MVPAHRKLPDDQGDRPKRGKGGKMFQLFQHPRCREMKGMILDEQPPPPS
jgi:hypothetical protein